MPLLEDVKAFAERKTGIARPKPAALDGLLRKRDPRRFRFRNGGEINDMPAQTAV